MIIIFGIKICLLDSITIYILAMNNFYWRHVWITWQVQPAIPELITDDLIKSAIIIIANDLF